MLFLCGVVLRCVGCSFLQFLLFHLGVSRVCFVSLKNGIEGVGGVGVGVCVGVGVGVGVLRFGSIRFGSIRFQFLSLIITPCSTPMEFQRSNTYYQVENKVS